MNRTKIIAMYLPQYHRIPENDEFWGEGFTDWVTVKASKPLYDGHCQPRIPLGNNYYDLSRKEDIIWQANLAKAYGIYGFGVYHYWFNNEKNLLTKPAEIIRDSNDIDIPYLLAWDNANWKRSWSNVIGNSWAPVAEKPSDRKNSPEILIPYILGNESDWKNHYDYLHTHFENEKYIKIGNKPVFIVFQYSERILEMCTFWDTLAKEDGFDGVFVIFKNNRVAGIPDNSFVFNYEPLFSGWNKSLPYYTRAINKMCRILKIEQGIKYYDYDKIWSVILKSALNSKRNNFFGAFVSYDDTPRRGSRGIVVKGASPSKFEVYLSQLISISDKQEKKFIFLTAWNEWGEGAYLEPDTLNHHKYLEALQSAILK